jgi:inhibitor of cysteine peptidase
VVLRPSLLLITVIAICTASFGQQAASASKAQSASSNVLLTEQDNGKDIDLTIGSTLIVKLPGNPSTGYNWTIVGEPSPLKLQKTSFRKGATKGSSVGASGTATFQLSANSSGLATLTLVYRRSWEYNVAPIKTFAVRVDVR